RHIYVSRYQWPGSNRHSVRNMILSHARLPIPPHWHIKSIGGGNRIGTGGKGFAVLCLTTWLCRLVKVSWSGRRDSNPRPPPWQGGVLPLNYFRNKSWATRIRT